MLKMGFFSLLFGKKEKKVTTRRLYKLNSDTDYENNSDVIMGLEYIATLQVSTSLEVLKHNGEIFNGPPSKAPVYGNQAAGCWIPKVDPQYNLAAGMVSKSASDIGPILENEYIPFLIDFRKIVEDGKSDIEKLEQLKQLKNIGKYKGIWTKLKKSYNDFPQSFFYSAFTEINGIGRNTAKNIYDAGFMSMDDLFSAKDSDLLKIGGVGKASIQKIKAHRMAAK
jgi:ribosomal protein S13